MQLTTTEGEKKKKKTLPERERYSNIAFPNKDLLDQPLANKHLGSVKKTYLREKQFSREIAC